MMNLLSRYKGCLMGALLGDCIGVHFEVPRVGRTIPWSEVESFIKWKLSNPQPPLCFSDDTAMTQQLAESLLECGKFDAENLARKFAEGYFADVERQKYYAKVKFVFEAWREANYADLYDISARQFEGRGSFGNGGGMRIAPVALFCGQDETRLLEIARDSTRLTHSSPEGYSGAMLQAYAIHLALFGDWRSWRDFIFRLSKYCEDKLEHPEARDIYLQKFRQADELLSKDQFDAMDVADSLGNSVRASASIPTAIFCALRTLKTASLDKCDEAMLDVITYAISLGGDTDTIASMAGAIVGAVVGIEKISDSLHNICEAKDKTLQLATQLFEVSHPQRPNS